METSTIANPRVAALFKSDPVVVAPAGPARRVREPLMSEQDIPTPQKTAPIKAAAEAGNRLTLSGVRRIFRLVGEIRELGGDPNQWRPHMVKRLAKLMNAEIVVSSEIHFRAIGKTGIYRVHDIGWGCDNEGQTWQINTEREETPEAYWLSVLNKAPAPAAPAASTPTTETPAKEGEVESLVVVKPQRSVYGGTMFVLSQFPLPHVGAVDQLGLHRIGGVKPFTHEEHRLL